MNHEGTKTQREHIPDEVENVARTVVDSAFRVHSQLGPGLLESIYEECVAHELKKIPLKVDRQLTVPIVYDGICFETGLRLDMLVEDCVLVELKAVDKVIPVHHAQVLSYLKLCGLRLGLLINFNVPLIKDGIKRIVL
jgi:GxxExxY protein